MLKNKTNIKHIAIVLIGLIVLNFIGSNVYKRFDLTKDQRYTLSETTKTIVESAKGPLIIDVFLEGDLPSEFRLLQFETKQLIEEFQLLNPLVKVNYIDPLEDEANRERIIEELTRSGLEPYINSSKTSGKVTQELIFGWAFASYQGVTQKIPLFKKSLTEDLQTQIANSIQQLEYHFADGFNKIIKEKVKL